VIAKTFFSTTPGYQAGNRNAQSAGAPISTVYSDQSESDEPATVSVPNVTVRSLDQNQAIDQLLIRHALNMNVGRASARQVGLKADLQSRIKLAGSITSENASLRASVEVVRKDCVELRHAVNS